MTDAGNTEYLLKIFYENYGKIRGYVHSCTRNHHGTEEILQAVAIKIAQNANAFDKDRPVIPWVFGIAKNQILQWFDKNKKQQAFVSFEVLDQYAQQLEVFSSEKVSPRIEALESCINRLPSNQRKVLELRYLEGEGCSEIAGILGKTHHSIYSLLKRLKGSLRKCIEFQMKGSGVSS